MSSSAACTWPRLAAALADSAATAAVTSSAA